MARQARGASNGPKQGDAEGPAFPPYKLQPVDALIPYVRNARTHSPEQIAMIAGSIREFGFTNPILTDGRKGVVAGHGRLLAAQKLGLKEVPTIDLEHLTPTQRRAYVIADNQLALKAGWDNEMLAMELGDLKTDDFDLETIGWSEMDLRRLLGDDPTDPAGEWTGMPEFDQPDKTAFRSMTVHFKDQGAVDLFARTIGQNITDKTRFVWFPEIEIETYADKRYVAEDGDAA